MKSVHQGFPSFLIAVVSLFLLTACALAASPVQTRIFVSPSGNDANSGSLLQPVATPHRAQALVRALTGRSQGIEVILRAGTYYLSQPLVFTAEDSGSVAAPVSWQAYEGEKPVISGGVKLELRWQPFKNGILKAEVPDGLQTDQLFVNGRRQILARYPNFDPAQRVFNGCAADAISKERVARWADPAGGYFHALHQALWGGYSFRITGKNDQGEATLEGGWQNNRGGPPHRQYRYVENIFEELDAPGEWFLDARTHTLYFYPPAGLDINHATIEAARLRHVIEFRGSRAGPVKFITLKGLAFCHAARTFMENKEPLLRSDWTTYRGGAVFFDGAEDAAIEDCDFDQLGGNAVFINNYNRRVIVRGCLIRECGANGVAFVGDPKAVRSGIGWDRQNDYVTMDRTLGPGSENYPSDCLVEDCLITRSGRFEKQTAPIEIDMARRVTVRHCSIYDVPRAGINIGDGCWGGHLIEHCDVFDTVLETGDHGSFNSWGRDRFWNLRGAPAAELPALALLDVVEPNTLRHNRWRCDHGWDIDLDDGSSHYVICNNLLLNGGLKLREGFWRVATNNIILGNSLHPHVWFANSGDWFLRNIIMAAYRPALMNIPKWGAGVDYNLFATTESDRRKFAAQGCDRHSLVGNPRFVNMAAGDFRVREDSPALKLGFVNFPMDQFGVRSPRLKALARAPAMPKLTLGEEVGLMAAGPQVHWRGAIFRELEGQEYSALGVGGETRGVFVLKVPESSEAFRAGLRSGDFIERLNGQPLESLTTFQKAVSRLQPAQDPDLDIIRDQKRISIKGKE